MQLRATAETAYSTEAQPSSPAVMVYLEREAAVLLGLSARTLQRMRLEGGGPAYVQLTPQRIGYTPEALRIWLDARIVRSTAHSKNTRAAREVGCA